MIVLGVSLGVIFSGTGEVHELLRIFQDGKNDMNAFLTMGKQWFLSLDCEKRICDIREHFPMMQRILKNSMAFLCQIFAQTGFRSV